MPECRSIKVPASSDGAAAAPVEELSCRGEMTVERARVVAIEATTAEGVAALWVEVFQASSCGQCAARSGCGQGALNRWFGRRGSHRLRVLCEVGQADLLVVGQWVEIGLAEGVLLQASLAAYLLPLLGLIGFAAAFNTRWPGDAAALLGGLLGFFVGLYALRHYAAKWSTQRHRQPRLLGAVETR